MQLGFNMAGTEEGFQEMILSAAAEPPYTYLEIGAAHCDTLIAVSKFLFTRRMKYVCHGIDLVGGGFFDPLFFIKNCPARCSFSANMYHRLLDAPDEWGTHLHLLGAGTNPEDFFKDCGPLDFCLIDGCHGSACVVNDFTRIEKEIARGGIVAFHDACEEDQGKDFQPHCGEAINVRAALAELGLLDGSRPGWKPAGEAHGDKSRSGNGFAFFQRI